MLSVQLCSCLPDGWPIATPDVLRIHLNSKQNDIQKQKASRTQRSELHADGESAGIIVIRPVPVFITFSDTGLNAALHSSKAKQRRGCCCTSRCSYCGGSGGWSKRRLTGLDHWTLNLPLPVGLDVISRCGIRRNTHMHTHAHKRNRRVFCAISKGHCMG